MYSFRINLRNFACWNRLLQKIMEIHNLLEAKSRLELREWLRQNHDKETECWVVVKRGRPVDDDTFWDVGCGGGFVFWLD